MAETTTIITIQMDSDLKAQADALFAELGMDLSTPSIFSFAKPFAKVKFRSI